MARLSGWTLAKAPTFTPIPQVEDANAMRNIVSLEGKTVVVTGAGQGIGRATINLARELGANAVAIDLNRDALSTYGTSDPKLMTITGSVTDETFATDAVEKI